MNADNREELTDELLGGLEAILMLAESPLSAGELADSFDMSGETILVALKELQADYLGQRGTRRRGFELREVAGGWRIYTSAQFADVVGQYVVGSAQAKLSQAALETLAVIAYRQPISRSRISSIRGVNVDGVIRTLVTRELIEEVGESVSGARLYGTTRLFLERMGFQSLEELEPLAPYLPAQEELEDLEELL